MTSDEAANLRPGDIVCCVDGAHQLNLCLVTHLETSIWQLVRDDGTRDVIMTTRPWSLKAFVTLDGFRAGTRHQQLEFMQEQRWLS